MTISLNAQKKFEALQIAVEAFLVDPGRITAIDRDQGLAVPRCDQHFAGFAVKSCIALTLLHMLTACTARPHVASEQARRADALFKMHCATAGETIKRTVSDIEGILLLKGRPAKTNYSDQFLMDDPYGSDLGGEGYIESFLKARHEPGRRYAALLKSPPAPDQNESIGYDYVDMADPVAGVRYRYTAYVDQPGKTDPKFALNYFPVILQKMPATGQMPRYGVTYEDISTHEDRLHWIAGSSLKVIDLKTNEVVAERIGYMIDRGRGVTAGGRSPWLLAARMACPAFPGQHANQSGQAARFVEKVLAPVRNAKH